MAGEKILDIDDSPTVQRLIEMILSSQGYNVVLASDGEEGIAKARSERPAVILVDFVMPKMNGFQVCKTLKDDPSFKDTPIILVTSKGDKVGSKFVNVLGITEYFTKPFQPEELLAKIRAVIDSPKAEPAPLPVRLEGKIHSFKRPITHRYCTEALIKPAPGHETSGLDKEALKRAIAGFGDSLVLAGSKDALRFHIHTDTPAELFYGIRSRIVAMSFCEPRSCVS